jgi:hypothetical protein
MSAPENILTKIKLLMKLASSDNENEANTAKTLAEKLIEKYSISEEELSSLKEKKSIYGDEAKIFTVTEIVGWKNQLVLAVAKKFSCLIIQEESVPSSGVSQFSYYAYGEDEDIETTKLVYNTLSKKVEELLLTKCIGRGGIFISSYAEGVVQSIKINIEYDDIELPKVNKTVKTSQTKDESKVGTEIT